MNLLKLKSDYSLGHYLIMALVLFGMCLLSPDALAQDGDASRWGFDNQTAKDIIAGAKWLFNLIMWACMIIGVVWLVVMWVTGEHDAWKRAAVLVLAGFFLGPFLDWVAERGELDESFGMLHQTSIEIVIAQVTINRETNLSLG